MPIRLPVPAKPRRMSLGAALAVGLAMALEYLAKAHPHEDVRLYARVGCVAVWAVLLALGFMR